MKYSLISLFSLLFFSSAFADPCADQESALNNSIDHYKSVNEEYQLTGDGYREAEGFYIEVFRSLMKATESQKMSSDLVAEQEQIQQIEAEFRHVKNAFASLKQVYDQKERLRDAVVKARETLTHLENSLTHCLEQNNPQE